MIRIKHFLFSENTKNFLSNSFYVGISNIIALISPLVAIPHVVKTVGLTNYGLSSIALSISMITVLIINFGFDISGVNRIAKDKNKTNIIEIIISITYAKTFLFVVVLTSIVTGLIVIPPLKEYSVLLMYSLIIPFSALFNLNWALQGMEKFKYLSIFNIIGKTIFLIGVLITITNKEDYVLINAWTGTGTIITGILSIYLILRTLPKTVKIRPTKTLIIRELKDSYEYFLSNISIYSSMYLYTFIVGALTTNAMAGVFAIIEKIYNLIKAPFSIYQSIMHPRLSILLEQSYTKAKKAIVGTYFFVIILIISMVLSIMLFQQQVVGYFVNDYTLLTKKAMLLSLFGIVFVAINCPIYLIALAKDMKKEIMRVFIKIPIIGLLSCVFLVHFFGIFGAIYSLIFTEALYALLLFNELKKLK